MVKGISRQIILVHSPDPRLFEQAIFILKDSVPQNSISDDILLQEAKRVIQSGSSLGKKRNLCYYGAFWAGIGALAMGSLWFLSLVI